MVNSENKLLRHYDFYSLELLDPKLFIYLHANISTLFYNAILYKFCVRANDWH